MNEDLQGMIDRMHALQDEMRRMPITVTEYRFGDPVVRTWFVRACEAAAPALKPVDPHRGILGDLCGIRLVEDNAVPAKHLKLVFSDGRTELRRIVL